MSAKERDRLRVVNDLEKGRLRQRGAAGLLGVSVRQVRRILARYRKEGDGGLVHRLRNRRSNRKIPEKVRKRAMKRVKARYEDFGPTLAAEYLQSDDGISVSRETLRGWMIEAGHWKPRRRKVRHCQWRERKSCFGELVQVDTSIHDWLEGRGEEFVLISMIDDATSRLWARFFPSDSTVTNMLALRGYLRKHGRPLAIYADKASHFRTTRQPQLEEALEGRKAETQIQRALRELSVQYITAHSPQAKGRVERSFKTAQDRLIKGMRLEGISTIEEANAYVTATFLPLWNRRFTVQAASGIDAHRPLKGYDLASILHIRTPRTVANDYTIRHHGQLYQIVSSEIKAGLRRSKVSVEEHLNGQLKIRWRNRSLRYRRIAARRERKQKRRGSATPVGLRPPCVADPRKSSTPAPDHPWRKRTVLSGRKGDISTLR